MTVQDSVRPMELQNKHSFYDIKFKMVLNQQNWKNYHPN